MEDFKEEKISEAQTAEIGTDNSVEHSLDRSGDNYKANIEEKRKKDFHIELVLVFILGILIGIAVKSEALKKITIGYDDYKMTISKQDYNIKKFQKDMISQREEAIKNETANDQSQTDDASGNN